MSTISRFAPKVARSATLFHQRNMASATASEPVQKLFVDKVREFKSANKGLDAAHEKALSEEMARLKRVYRVDDENKLAQLDLKFSPEHNVALYDLDENKAKREAIASGEYQRQIAAAPKEPSALIASIPEQVTHDMHLPPFNKPDYTIILNNLGPPSPTTVGAYVPDTESASLDPMTPEKLEDELEVKFGKDMPTIHDDESPERDAVNYPRQVQPETQPPTRFHIIPYSWFVNLHPKTGVSGPYVFGASFGTFLFSKEWLVMDHELLAGFSSICIFSYAFWKFGPQVSAYIHKQVRDEMDGWDNWQHGNIKFLDDAQEHYRGELDKASLIKSLYEARRQDIDVQLETEYRRRIKTAYEDTKRRLNYLVSVADSTRQIQQKNMVNWVISNAVSSFGTKQESDVLDNCIVNLKQLASKNANVI